MMQPLLDYFAGHINAMRWGKRYVVRTPLSTVFLVSVLGVSFALPLSIWIIATNVQHLTQHWQQEAQLSIYLSPDVALPPKGLLTDVRSDDEVAYANYVSPDQGMQLLEQQSGLALTTQWFEKNPLPAVIEVHPGKQLSDQQATAMAKRFRGMKGVSAVQLDHQWQLRLVAIGSFLKRAALGLMLAFSLAIALIVGHTIRLVMMEREGEIRVLQLVGATSAFVRRPFLYFGFVLGGLGAIVAISLIYIMIYWMQHQLDQLIGIYAIPIHLYWPHWQQLVMLVLAGAAMGAVGAWWAMPRRLFDYTTLVGT